MNAWAYRRICAAAVAAVLISLPAAAQETVLPPPPPLDLLIDGIPAAKTNSDQRSVEGIAVDSLEGFDLGQIGTMTVEAAGFEAGAWRGLDLGDIAAASAGMTSRAASLHTRRRLLRLLAAPLSPQAGVDPQGFVAARLEGLLNLGDVETAAALAARVPSSAKTDAIAKAEVSALLRRGNLEAGCERLRALLLNFDPTPEAQHLALLCNRQQGNSVQADFALDLLREIGQTSPAVVEADTWLAEASGIARPLPSVFLDDADWLQLGLAAEGVADADAWAASTPARAARLLALAPNPGFETALAAAEVAVEAGLLSLEELRALYRRLAFEPLELAAPLPGDFVADTPRKRAFLIQRLEAANAEVATPETEAAGREALERLLDGVRGLRLYQPLAEMLVADLAAVSASRPAAWSALGMGRGLVANDRWPRAMEWLTVARQAAPTAPETWRLAWLARLGGAQIAPIPADGISGAAALAPRLPALVAALDQALQAADPTAWTGTLERFKEAPQDLPGAEDLERLGQAAQEGAAAVLFAVDQAFAGHRLAELHPVLLFTATSALARVGEAELARHLAIEAAIAHGL